MTRLTMSAGQRQTAFRRCLLKRVFVCVPRVGAARRRVDLRYSQKLLPNSGGIGPMAELNYAPVKHDHKAFLAKSAKRCGFEEAYDALEVEYALAREMLAARPDPDCPAAAGPSQT